MSAGFQGNIGTLTPLIDENNFPVYDSSWWYRIPLFDYRHTLPELIYTDKNGIQYEMDRHFRTDGGSIPFMLRAMPFAHLDPFNFPRSYLYHDCGYQYGGLYIKYPTDTIFKFRLMSRLQIDNLLKEMLPFDGATKYDTKTIYFGVRLGNRYNFAKQKEARKQDGVVLHNSLGDVIEDT